MRPYRTATRQASLSLKHWVSRGSLVLLVMASLVMISMSRDDSHWVHNLRTVFTDGFAPLVDALSAPAAFVETVNEKIDHLVFLYQDNARLREENKRLLQWQSVARQLEVENASLRELTDLPAPTQFAFTTARVVGAAGHTYNNRLVLDAGERHGVRQQEAVVSNDGVVGRVVNTGFRTSQVLAITDINSRIPVIAETSRDKAILAGDNSATPGMMYLPEETSIAVGERIVTTDDGGVFPAGLIVGEVASIDGNNVRITPYANFDKLEYVRIVSKVTE